MPVSAIRTICREWLPRCLAVLVVLLAGWTACAMAADSPDPFINLEKRLIEDGFDQARIQAIFSSENVSFEKGGVSAYFMHNEAKLNYKQFTRIWNISAAKSYMQTHQAALETAPRDRDLIRTVAAMYEEKISLLQDANDLPHGS